MFIALLRQTRRPTLHLLKKPGGVPSKKQRELDPTVLDNLSEGKGLQKGGGSKNNHGDWWGRGMDPRRRVDHWAAHIFREHFWFDVDWKAQENGPTNAYESVN